MLVPHTCYRLCVRPTSATGNNGRPVVSRQTSAHLCHGLFTTTADRPGHQRELSEPHLHSQHTIVGKESAFMEESVKWMHEALTMARKALERKEVPVGCVVVRKGEAIACGHNEVNATLNATRHAEMVAFDQLMDVSKKEGISVEALCEECVLYVTLEPCVMCAYALRLVGLTNVVFGGHNDRFGGCGSVLNVSSAEDLGAPADWPKRTLPPLELTLGVLEAEAVALLQEFYEEENSHAPEDKRKRKKLGRKQ